MLRLRIEVNDPTDGSVRQQEFTTSPVRIGRRPGNDLVLRHSYVSEPHAQIEFDAEGVRVVDLGSRNGTSVLGGGPVKDRATPLERGSRVEIGPFMLVVSALSDADLVADVHLPPTMPLLRLPEIIPPEDVMLDRRATEARPVAESSWPVPPLPIVIAPPPGPKDAAAVALPAPPPLEAPVAAAPAVAQGPLAELVEESFEEAVFLWGLWEDGLVSHGRDLESLASFVEERLLGALEGIRAGGDSAFELLIAPALASEDPCLLAVAAHVVVSGGPGRDALLGVLGGAEGERLAALRRGVELGSSVPEIAAVERRLCEAGPAQLAALMTLRAFRRSPPGPELDRLLRSEESRSRVAGLRAARHVPGHGALPFVELALGDPDPAVAAAAVESGLYLGSRAAWIRCRELVKIRAPGIGPLLSLVAMLGLERDQELVLAAVGREGLHRDALVALAHVGTVVAAEACLAAMAVDEDARLAAESFCTITGLDLHAEDLVAAEPPGPEEPVPFEDEDLDADLVPKPDDLLPLPDVQGVQRWWDRNRQRFAAGRRHVMGKPASLAALQEVLESASMRRRHAAALELRIRTGGQYDVETRTFVAEQRRQMQRFTAVRDGRTLPPSLAGLISRI